MPCPSHDDVIKWKHFPRYWQFGRGIHRSPVSDTELWCFLWSVYINGCVNNNREVGDLRRYGAHYDVSVMGHAYFMEVSFIYTLEIGAELMYFVTPLNKSLLNLKAFFSIFDAHNSAGCYSEGVDNGVYLIAIICYIITYADSWFSWNCIYRQHVHCQCELMLWNMHV